MFPDTVRAAVLDGAANPNVGWEAEKTEQAVGLERAFLTVMQSCAADPGCPFFNGGDPVSAYEALSASLDAAPVTGDPTRPPANQSVLFYATLVALRDSNGWDELYRALAAAQKGDVSGLFSLYDAYVRARPDGTFSNAVEAFVAIDCLDDPGPTDPAELAAIDARIRQAAPHMGIGLAVAARLRRLARSPGSAPAPDGGGRRARSSSSARRVTPSPPSRARRAWPTRSSRACS